MKGNFSTVTSNFINSKKKNSHSSSINTLHIQQQKKHKRINFEWNNFIQNICYHAEHNIRTTKNRITHKSTRTPPQKNIHSKPIDSTNRTFDYKKTTHEIKHKASEPPAGRQREPSTHTHPTRDHILNIYTSEQNLFKCARKGHAVIK